MQDTAGGTNRMDEMYRYQRYFYDLTRKHYLLGRDTLIKELNPPRNGKVLEIGCGTGRNLIKAAQHYPACQFYGFDVSTVMLDTAMNSIKRAKLQDNVHLAFGDATNFDGAKTFNVPQYDRIFISYALSMIPPWRAVLDHMMTLVVTGGSIHIVDFGQQEKLPNWFRKVLYFWLARFSVHPQAELHGELVKTAEKHGASLTFTPLYRGYAEYAVLVNKN